MSKRVLLTEEDFDKLIKGEIIEQNGVEIALQDIGYMNMMMKFYKLMYDGQEKE